jgi:hypothetical protein
MDARRLTNGNLLVPVPLYSDGVQGEGMLEVEPGSELYKAWAPSVTDNGAVTESPS